MQFGPGFLPTFLYYFSGTALVFAFITAKALGVGFGSGLPQQVGAAGGVAAGLLAGYFYRTTTMTIAFKDKKAKNAFVATLDDIMDKLGYRASEPLDEGVLVYEKPGISKFLSGKVFVEITDSEATLASRAVQVKQLKTVIQ